MTSFRTAASRCQTLDHMGRVRTDRTTYRPTDAVEFSMERAGTRKCRVYVFDAGHHLYCSRKVRLKNGRGSVVFPARGLVGTHMIRVIFDDEVYRFCYFSVKNRTFLETGIPAFDEIQPQLEEIAAKCSAVVTVRGKPAQLSGRAGDNPLYIWFRDGGYGLLGYVYWHPYLKEFCDNFLATQDKDGFFKDIWALYCDRYSRCYGETDVEYIAVLVAHRVWQATGDDAWLKRQLPRLENGIETSMRPHPMKRVKEPISGKYLVVLNMNCWDPASRLIKRVHSCDTWDFEVKPPDGSHVFVLANCDQSGFYLAARLLADMNRHFGHTRRAAYWTKVAAVFQRQTDKLLWDGVKYQHHRHLDQLDHGDFKERDQLSMGNVWAVTRGLADHRKAVSIIREYQRRWKKTGDKYPWWSLQPGYPNGTFTQVGTRKYWDTQQGVYANGGLMSWVGGELAQAALEHGFEEFGVQQIRLYHSLCRKHGGGYTWYWLNGEPGLSDPQSTGHSIWDIGSWMKAVQESLAGIRDQFKMFERVRCAPKWAAAGVNNARAVSGYPRTMAYFGYSYIYYPKTRTLRLDFDGSGREVEFSVLLPKGHRVASVTIDGKRVAHTVEKIEQSGYCCFHAKIRRSLAADSMNILTRNFREYPMPPVPADMNRAIIRLERKNRQL